jgi:UDP-2,3-diacylglucosamine hydrolase
MATLFISDLHLSPDKPELTQLVVNFLQQHTHDVSVLYLLGDIFNTWLGDDVVPSEFTPLVQQLHQLKQQGIAIYLMVGNRDFMLGQGFAQRSGCQLLRDPTVVDLYGQHVLLMHGDTLCTDDIAYQRYRLWSRNKFLQWCFLQLPMHFRRNIADKIKQKSQEQKQNKTAIIMDVNDHTVDKIIKKHDVKYLIHGHTHRPAIHHLTHDDNDFYRIVLGDWHDQISYLKCDEFSLKLIDHRIKDHQIELEFS